MRDKILNFKNIVIVVGILLLFMIVVGVSYAAWLVTAVQANDNIVKSGCFEISFVEDAGSTILVENAFPVTDSEGMNSSPYIFSVENTCDLNATYQVNLEVLNNTTLDKTLINGMLDTNTPDVMSNRTQVDATITGATSYNLSSYKLAGGESRSHEFKMWIDESGTLDNSQNKVIAAKIVIIFVPDVDGSSTGGGDELTDVEICIADYQSQGITPTSIDNFQYDNTKDVVTIYSYNDIAPKDVVIPCEVGGKPVVAIEDSAFVSKGINSVIFPYGIKSIGWQSFYGNNLTALVLPDSVTSVGAGAFGANKLTSVKLSENLTVLSEGVFVENSLTTVTIPNSVTSILGTSFSQNDLTTVSIGSSVTEIGFGAFANNKISTLVLPDSLITLGENAFHSNLLTSVDLGEGLVTIGISAFEGNAITSLVIPNTTTTISGNAFLGNKIATITLGTSLTSVGPAAFYNNLITSLALPSSIVTISENAFHTNRITSLTLNAGLVTIGNSAFQANNISALTIPSSVLNVGTWAFVGNDSLTTINVEGKSSSSQFTFAGEYWNNLATVNYLG